MHTVVFGWFGGSAVWFIPLLWRLVKSVLPGGAGLRGPGTIRLWLGFVCVMAASCTLEASLIGVAGVNGLGHALAAGFGHLLGHIGTPLAALALLAISLPWLIDFRWRDFAAWADGAFGLGLSRGLAKRDEAARRHRSVDDGLPSHVSPATNTMAPKSNGRYARPTVWRPPASGRGAGTAGAGAGAGKAGTAAGRDAAARGAGSSWRAGAPTPRSQPTQIEPVLRTGASTSPRQASVQNQAPNADKAAFMPTEPVAPAGWLRETAPRAGASVAGAAVGTGAFGASGASGASGAVPRDAALQVGRRSAGEQRSAGSFGAGAGLAAAAAAAGASGASAKAAHAGAAARTASGAATSSAAGSLANAAAGASRPSTMQGAAGAAAPVTRTAIPGQPFPAAPLANGVTPTSATRRPTPSYTRPMATTQKVSPPASVEETLRSIAENAARWTDLAGVSLARSSSAEGVKVVAAANAAPSVEVEQSGDGAQGIGAVQTAASASAYEPLQEVVERASAPSFAQAPVETAPIEPAWMETAIDTPVEASTESVVQWPIEPPIIHAPLTDTPVLAANVAAVDMAEAAAVDAAFVPAASVPATSEPAVRTSHDTAPLHVASASESAPSHNTETVDAPPLPDVSEPAGAFASSTATNAANLAASVTPQSVEPHASSNVVRFPGFAAQAARSASADRVEETLSAFAPAIADAPSSEPSIAAIASTTPTTPGPPTAPPPPQLTTEPTPEPAVQRPPLRGHAPANGFEFRAPAASMVELPTLDLLARADTDVEPVSEEKLIETGLLIEQRLQEFKVPVTVVGASAGPVITRFEVEPALGVRGSQIVGLMKDLSRGLGLTSIRVVETIPGKTCMGLELPNAKRQTIRLSEILEASVYQNSHSQLTLAMGKDITGHPVVADLAKAPHMLVAGTTGSGKSVAINAMICSLLYKATPEEVRLIMIDPKMLELSVYEGIPHLLAPVVTDMKLAANALNWCVGEMEKRYRLMSAVGVRNLAGFNQKIRDTEAKGKKLGNPFSLTPEAPEPLAPLPLIVVVIDELADLMMVAGKKIEELIARLAQKARAAGIHLILATQRPSVDVITGLIKANIPTRVAFQVSSKIDSRTILDQMGAESLLGQGDMLFLPPGTGYPQRVHGAFVADEEVHRIVEYLKQFGEPQYEEGILDGPATDGGAAQDLFGESPDAEADPLYDEAVAFVVRTRRASISSVQRQLRIGYNRAARLVEQMETAGLVSAMSINGSREVLAPGPAE
ncbi:hypothetical protein LMG28614_03210 [Paraburkholderia ultramafica]|uniref:FtsK domain-containing protein n=1 Tax=Paraburkholderia ultramafica TaxID=1544867 RepID=A0A6S7B833_9BURK|nr:DNA translocase FtsK [Paraburkholderia ultramafica]CAB3791055.1 hypothetical protein LMG28614_03210 [Paraburkholderia ultramafica]